MLRRLVCVFSSAWLLVLVRGGSASIAQREGSRVERVHVPSSAERIGLEHANRHKHMISGGSDKKVEGHLTNITSVGPLTNDSNSTTASVEHQNNTTSLRPLSTNKHAFPVRIPVFSVRTYNTSGIQSNVTSDRMKLLRKGERYTLKKYKELLQCAEFEPEIEEARNGVFHLMRHLPLTQTALEAVSAYLEDASSKCSLWHGCRDRAVDMKRQGAKYTEKKKSAPWSYVVMLRVRGGQFYYDWPWGRSRDDQNLQQERDTRYAKLPFMEVINSLSDLNDSVFFVGEEGNVLPPNIPVPLLSSSPRWTSSSDLPLPWSEAYDAMRKRYVAGQQEILGRDHGKPWDQRVDKAAFFGGHQKTESSPHAQGRQVIWNLAIKYPEHVEAGISFCNHITGINPKSHIGVFSCTGTKAEVEKRVEETLRGDEGKDNPDNKGFGFPTTIMSLKLEKSVDYMHNYRYLVVAEGLMASGRLALLMAYSGAVILMQETESVYHFSLRLKPWVHYVPLTATAADLVEKVIWLKENQEMAKTLAMNAKYFAASYLRLEDYHCYIATFLEKTSEVMTPEVLEPYDPVLLRLQSDLIFPETIYGPPLTSVTKRLRGRE